MGLKIQKIFFIIFKFFFYPSLFFLIYLYQDKIYKNILIFLK
jgi:hypothetical protein